MADPKPPTFITPSSPNSIVRPLYKERDMKCYVVTDSELNSLSLANGLMVVFFSLASAFAGFGVDISKDLLLTPEATTDAKALADMARTVCFGFAAAFAGAGVWAYTWKRGSLRLIKKESGDLQPDGLFEKLHKSLWPQNN